MVSEGLQLAQLPSYRDGVRGRGGAGQPRDRDVPAGFGFRIYWHYADTALHRRIKKDMEDLRAGKLEGRPLEDIIDELENKP